MIKIVYFILAHLIIVYYSHVASNYGPFNLVLNNITFCKGPKRKNCSMNTAQLVNDTVLIYDMNVTENMKDLQGNLFATSESKQTVRLQMKKLCDDPFWLPFMKLYVNITKDCIILKGNYRMVINVKELAQKYYGGSFIYGKWRFRSVYYNNACNFGCTFVYISLTPKQ